MHRPHVTILEWTVLKFSIDQLLSCSSLRHGGETESSCAGEPLSEFQPYGSEQGKLVTSFLQAPQVSPQERGTSQHLTHLGRRQKVTEGTGDTWTGSLPCLCMKCLALAIKCLETGCVFSCVCSHVWRCTHVCASAYAPMYRCVMISSVII